MVESFSVNIRNDDIGSDKTLGSDQKVTKLERFFLIANFILELPSAAFDQLSSLHKPKYALLSMLMSLIVMVFFIINLVYKGKKGGVIWMKKDMIIPWFYYPYPNLKPFGTFADIIGLIFAVFQCIFASIAYTLLSQNIDNPIKISVWPFVFAIGLLYSRLLEGNHTQKGSSPKVIRRLSKVVEFTLAELATVTDNFSSRNKVAVGSNGVLYRGKLVDGSEIRVYRWGKGEEKKLSEEELSAFESELEFLSRLHHKHLVGLKGYYEDENERLLVYDYMENRTLYHHLHEEKSDKRNSIVLKSWKMRIKIALDAARGIEYLHNYAVPPVIHRAIKSFNIVLDANWTARVGDFAFSTKVPELEHSYNTIEAAGTEGYIDPEYYNNKMLTSKSDVYSFGVVLLELLTGKKAIFKGDDSGGISTSVVDFAAPRIMEGEFVKVLDPRPRVSPPEVNEEQALELVAYVALHCVSLEGRNRPSMTSVVANLEQSLSLMDAAATTED